MAAVVRYTVEAPRANEMCAWLVCNDVSPRDVPLGSEVFVESDAGGVWTIRHRRYVRSASGAIVFDPLVQGPVKEWHQVPLVNDPPMWWLVECTAEAAPTGVGPPQAVPAEVVRATAGEPTVAEGAVARESARE